MAKYEKVKDKMAKYDLKLQKICNPLEPKHKIKTYVNFCSVSYNIEQHYFRRYVGRGNCSINSSAPTDVSHTFL